MSRPEVSIVVPTYSRPVGLRRCVTALLAQTVRDVEIVVVDDAGTPPAAETLADVADARLRIERRPQNAGPAAARNQGARVASAEILAFTDDDCAPRPNWLETLLVTRRNRPSAMIGGLTVNAMHREPHAEASQRLIDCLYDRLNPDAEDASFLTSNNILLPATDFAAVGGFDEDYPLAAGEDRAFCRSWRAGGRPILFNRGAVVDHYHGMTLRRFLRQHFNYGRGSWQYHRVEEKNSTASNATADRGRIGPGFALRLMAHPLREGRGQQMAFRLHVAALLAMSQAATITGSLAGWFGDTRDSPRAAERAGVGP